MFTGVRDRLSCAEYGRKSCCTLRLSQDRDGCRDEPVARWEVMLGSRGGARALSRSGASSSFAHWEAVAHRFSEHDPAKSASSLSKPLRRSTRSRSDRPRLSSTDSPRAPLPDQNSPRIAWFRSSGADRVTQPANVGSAYVQSGSTEQRVLTTCGHNPIFSEVRPPGLGAFERDRHLVLKLVALDREARARISRQCAGVVRREADALLGA